MHTFKTMNGNESMQGFLLDLQDQVEALHECHRAIDALGHFVEVAGSSNAATAPKLASLMRLVSEALAARTAELESSINAANRLAPKHMPAGEGRGREAVQ